MVRKILKVFNKPVLSEALVNTPVPAGALQSQVDMPVIQAKNSLFSASPQIAAAFPGQSCSSVPVAELVQEFVSKPAAETPDNHCMECGRETDTLLFVDERWVCQSCMLFLVNTMVCEACNKHVQQRVFFDEKMLCISCRNSKEKAKKGNF